MALEPIDEVHALQIQAGILGRQVGHQFEDHITQCINSLQYPFATQAQAGNHHLFIGEPEKHLLNYICIRENIPTALNVVAISTGALATSEEGKRWLAVNGVPVSRCKSDLVITITKTDGTLVTVGISTKQCNTRSPTNAQLYFTTAQGFSTLLRNNGIHTSDHALIALRQFCGDSGFQPLDDHISLTNRQTDPRRYFWEEIDEIGRAEWEGLFANRQDEISRLLLQKAYLNDPFTPEYLLHKTKRASSWDQTEIAIYSINELIAMSRAYQGFCTKSYSVKKGSYKDPQGVMHDAPRFGVIQMQRGGQAQHPNQLQFNLEAGYFYKI